ncbi:MAG: PKD domain-containing protein [Saprospiraceae bacterium]
MTISLYIGERCRYYYTVLFSNHTKYAQIILSKKLRNEPRISCTNTYSLLFTLTLSLLMLASIVGFGQSPNVGYCGALPPHQATTTHPDSILYDRFGNTYDKYPLSNLIANSNHEVVVGYFQLVYLDDFAPAFEGVINTVFQELSTLIVQRQLDTPCGDPITQDLVRIEISSTTLEDDIIATGTPMFDPDIHRSGCVYLQNSRAYAKINGIHYYNELGVRDGKIRISTAFNFDTSYPAPMSNPNHIDLYTAILHEALHVLAFHPRVDFDDPVAYTDYDFLLVGSQDKIIESNCTTNCYTSHLAGEANTPTCNIRVGDNGPFVAAHNNLSHLADNATPCGNNTYVMNAGLPAGTRKSITNDEINILCQMGYQTTTCDGEFFLPYEGTGYNSNNCSEYTACCENIFYTCENSIEIPYADLICFTHGNVAYTITDMFLITGIANITMGSNAVVIENTVPTISTIRLGFTITSTTTTDPMICKSKNGSFWVSFDRTCQQNHCEFDDECENILCYGDFENFATLGNISLGFPFIFDGSCNNSPDIFHYPAVTENRALFIGLREEAVALRLNSPSPYTGCDITLTFDAGNRLSGVNPILEIWGSAVPPCHMNDTPVPQSCVGVSVPCADGSIYAPVCLGNIPITNTNTLGSYPPITIPASTFNTGEINFLIFSFSVGTGGIFLDNLRLTANCANAEFTNTVANCNQYTFTGTYSNSRQVSHSWDFSDGTTSTQANPTHTYTTNGTYSITHTVTDNCGNTQTATQNIVIDCIPVFDCPCVDAYNIGQNGATTLLSQTPLSGNILAGACVAIVGKLLVDKDFTFKTCDIRMQSGASIEVQGGADPKLLTFMDSTNVHGCINMWQGVVLQPNAKISVVRATIADTEYAIKTDAGAEVSLAKSTFARNYIGLYHPPGVGNFNLSFFRGNTFHCSDGTNYVNLLPPYSEQATMLTNITLVGIEINDVSAFQLGASPDGATSLSNAFHHVANGIRLYNSHTIVRDCKFYDIGMNESENILTSGNGIFAKGNMHTLKQVGGTNTGDISFERVKMGIQAYGMQVTGIRQNRMKMVKRGIRILLPQISAIVYDNTIHADRLGIEIYQAREEITCDIHNNIITVDSPAECLSCSTTNGTGIEVNSDIAKFANSSIRYNTISLYGQNYGLYAYNINSVTVDNNIVNFQVPTLNKIGMAFKNGRDMTISCNDILGIVGSNDWAGGTNANILDEHTIGILSDRTTGRLGCNDILRTRVGVRFEGAVTNGNLTFETTNFSNHSVGLLLRPGTQIGEQSHTGNMWNTNSNSGTLPKAWHQDPVLAFQSRFL